VDFCLASSLDEPEFVHSLASNDEFEQGRYAHLRLPEPTGSQTW